MGSLRRGRTGVAGVFIGAFYGARLPCKLFFWYLHGTVFKGAGVGVAVAGGAVVVAQDLRIGPVGGSDVTVFPDPVSGAGDALGDFIFGYRLVNLEAGFGLLRVGCVVHHELQHRCAAGRVQTQVGAKVPTLFVHHFLP